MMKIVIKLNSIKELVTKAPNGTQHKNNVHPKTGPIDWLDAADQCVISHGTYMHVMI